MAVIILPDAQADLLSLQDYMLDKWGEVAWLKAEDEIFDKLEKVDSGVFNLETSPQRRKDAKIAKRTRCCMVFPIHHMGEHHGQEQQGLSC